MRRALQPIDRWRTALVEAGLPAVAVLLLATAAGLWLAWQVLEPVPVKRLVIALHPDGRVEGQNIIPGGQSGLTTSPHFTDQVALWLGNEALPLRFHLDQVVDGAVGREVYLP